MSTTAADQQQEQYGGGSSTGDNYKSVPTTDTSSTSPPTSTWESSSFWSKWTFSVANPLLLLGQQRPITFDDMMTIRHADQSHTLQQRLSDIYFNHSRQIWFIPRIMVALFKLHPKEWAAIGFYSIFEGCIRVATPLCLIFLLQSLSATEEEAKDSVWYNGYLWAGVISIMTLVQTFSHHVLFFLSMRMGWNWRTAATALIYDGLFHVNNAALQGTTSGKLVNLISNDVSRLEEFTLVSTTVVPHLSLSH